MEKRKPSYTVGGNGGSLTKVKAELSYDAAVPLLGTNQEREKQ